MKITKLGHCCLLIEENGTRILTDPGVFTVEEQSNIKNIDLLLISHEHQDHLHSESVQKLAKNNPGMKIVTNQSVGKILQNLSINFEVVAEGQSANVKNILIEAFGHEHAEIYEDYGKVENTGYFINNKLFFPGDAFTNPGKSVEVLALPVAGPWMAVKEAIKYAKILKPKVAFPVHDGFLQSGGFFHSLPKIFLEPLGIKFLPVKKGEVGEF